MRVFVVTPPAPVVTVEEARTHLKVEHNDEDTLITDMIAAATGHIDGPDGWLGRALGVQTLEARCEVFRDAMPLPYPPIVDIVSVKHLDAEGVERTVLASDYEVRGSLIGLAFGRRWPSVGCHPEAVSVRYRAGYAAVPAPIKAAILMMVDDLFRNRGEAVVGTIAAQVSMTPTVANLLSPFQVWR